MENKKVTRERKHDTKELLALFLTFLKLGAFTFGGGYAMISILRDAVVEKHQWLSDDEMLEIIGIAESTPGPISINMATFVGYKRQGFLGALLSTIGVVLPSMIIIFIISLFFEAFLSNQYVKYAFTGIKAGVSLLILNAGIDMIKKVQRRTIPILVLIFVILFMLLMEIFKFSFSSIFLILIGGFIGILTMNLKLIKRKGKK